MCVCVCQAQCEECSDHIQRLDDCQKQQHGQLQANIQAHNGALQLHRDQLEASTQQYTEQLGDRHHDVETFLREMKHDVATGRHYGRYMAELIHVDLLKIIQCSCKA